MGKFCTNCGSPLMAGARFCGNCGAAVVDATGGVADVNKSGSGALHQPAVSTSHQGDVPSESVPQNLEAPVSTVAGAVCDGKNGQPGRGALIHIEYPGYFSAIDVKLRVYINGRIECEHGFKSAWSVDLWTEERRVEVVVRMSFRKTRLWLDVVPGERYNLALTYNRLWGSISLLQVK